MLVYSEDSGKAAVQCKGCEEWVHPAFDDHRCTCNVQCCVECGSACIRYPGDHHRWCTVCDAQFIAECAADPDCDPPETAVQAQRRVLKLHAGEHPAFGGTWMGRVLTDFDEEPTRDIPVETMAQAVGR